MNPTSLRPRDQIQQTEQTPLIQRSEQQELVAKIEEWQDKRVTIVHSDITFSHILQVYNQSLHKLNFFYDDTLPDIFYLEKFKNNITVFKADEIRELPPSFKHLQNLRELHLIEKRSNNLCNRSLTCCISSIIAPVGYVTFCLGALLNPFSICKDGLSETCGTYRSIFSSISNMWYHDVKDLIAPYTLNLNVLVNFSHLQSLKLELWLATEFPESIRSLKQLKLIEFRTHATLTIPDWITELSLLQSLTIQSSHRGLHTSLPENIGHLQHLKKLQIMYYPLTFLPESLKSIVSLSELSLHRTQVHEIPQWINRLNGLTTLSVRGTTLNSIPDQLKEIFLLKHLELSSCHISEIPEYFSELSLETLDLHSNPLNKIPEVIKNIRTLKNLKLSDTHLSELPEWIGSLTEINELQLQYNHIKTLPDSIGNLTSLSFLTLDNNELSSLPESIGNLTSLQVIFLSNNLLREIPVTIGNLLQLETLDVQGNPNLHSLPMTLGNCSKLTHISYNLTPIFSLQVTAIMNRTRRLRDEEGLISFKTRLESWITYSGIDRKLQFLFDENVFSRQQQLDMNEWLLRLEVTKEFQRARDQLALLVCKILESLCPSEQPEAIEFKKAFFGHIDGNLVHCGDRAAMLLNLIYTDWQLLMINKNASDNEKMLLLIGIAKTQTLRNILQEFIRDYQSENILGGVETYLYYETKLKNRLGLITAVNSMLYEDVGRISSINEDDLVREVESKYVSTLCNLDSVDSILEKKVGFKEKKQAIVDSTQEEIEEVEAREWTQSNAYLSALNKVKETRDNEIVRLRKQYLDVK